jgi:hypothetical protein
MPNQGWTSLLVSQQADGAAVTTNLADTSMLNAQAKFTLPAGSLTYIGQGLRIRAMGRISNIITTPGTLTLRVKFGSVIVAASSAMQLNAVAKTNVTWVLDWDLVVRGAPGTACTLMHSGAWQSESVVGSPVPGTGGSGSFLIPTVTPAVGTSFDSTVANVVDLTANFSLTGNSLTCHTYKLESLN